MPIDNPDHWYLRKFDAGEIFGPVSFQKIQDWARSAQVNPQDMLSTDQVIWTKSPMVPELKMDWLVVLDKNLLYGPTTAEALLEFVRNGEVTANTEIINCTNEETCRLGEASFYSEEAVKKTEELAPSKGGIKLNLQQRIRDLEADLMEKRLRLAQANQTIARLESKVGELEVRVAKLSHSNKV